MLGKLTTKSTKGHKNTCTGTGLFHHEGHEEWNLLSYLMQELHAQYYLKGCGNTTSPYHSKHKNDVKCFVASPFVLFVSFVVKSWVMLSA
jgi:hypothetical protein